MQVKSTKKSRVVDAGATTVLYIGGSGRSGSTLLERLLGELDDVVTLGEVGHLWERGLRNDELCACGQPFSQCPFWHEVGERAFGGWSNVDPEWMLTLKDRVDRQRRMPQTSRRHVAPGMARDLEEYVDHYRRVYESAAAVAGRRIVVDSSKVAPTALALSHHSGIDLRLMHITRDSRGVAYSWLKAVSRPETSNRELMPQLTPTQSSLLWSSHNASIGLLRHRRVPVTRLRYEDLVAHPGPVVRRAFRELELLGDGELPLLGPTRIELGPTHSVAGNPMRFTIGTMDLRPDTEWKSRMKPNDRRLVTVLSHQSCSGSATCPDAGPRSRVGSAGEALR